MTDEIQELRKLVTEPPVLESWDSGESDPDTGLIPVRSKWNYTDFSVWVEADIGLDDYGIKFSRVEIEANSITAQTFQRLKIGTLRDRMAKWIRVAPGLINEDVTTARVIEQIESLGHDPTKVVIEFGAMTPEDVESVKASAREVKRLAKRLKGQPPSRRRGADNPDFYREIAQLYLEQLQVHGPRGVIQAMAEELDAKPNTVSQWVRKSRLKGWLGPAPKKGRAGGTKGDELIKWEKENQ